jgi:hypothetical protein
MFLLQRVIRVTTFTQIGNIRAKAKRARLGNSVETNIDLAAAISYSARPQTFDDKPQRRVSSTSLYLDLFTSRPLTTLTIKQCRCKLSPTTLTTNYSPATSSTPISNPPPQLRQDPHGQDHHPRGRVLRHNRQCQEQDPRQGGNPARPATLDLRRQTARRWSYTI